MKKNDPKIEELVIEMVTKGKSRKEVAAELGLTYSSVSHIILKHGKMPQKKEKFGMTSANNYINNVGSNMTAALIFNQATQYFQIQQGIRYIEAVRMVGYNPVTFPVTANINLVLKQVNLKVETVTLTSPKCPEGFIYLFEHQMKGSYEELVKNEKRAFVNKLSNMLWQGYSVEESIPNENGEIDCRCETKIKFIPGFLEELYTATVEVKNTVKLNYSNIIDETRRMISEYPNEVEELTLHVSPAHFQSLLGALVLRNILTWEEGKYEDSFTFPGTSTKVVLHSGLAGYNTMVLDRRSLTVGTDFSKGEEIFEYTYDRYTDMIQCKLNMKIGVVVSIPQEVLVYREPKA